MVVPTCVVALTYVSRWLLLHLVLLAHKTSPHIGLNFIPHLKSIVS